MLQRLTKPTCTRRAIGSLFPRPLLPAPHASRRFSEPQKNLDILNFLKDCEEKENSSPTRNEHKIYSLRRAAALIENLNFTVKHGDGFNPIRGVHPGVMEQIRVFLGQGNKPLKVKVTRAFAVGKLLTVPGISKARAEALYDAGCDTLLKLRNYREGLPAGAKSGLRFLEYLGLPVPKENVETIMNLFKKIMPTDRYEIIQVEKYRKPKFRKLSAVYPRPSVPIKILVVNKNPIYPVPVPPHPSTLESPYSYKFTIKDKPFTPHGVMRQLRGKPVESRVIRLLKDKGVVAATVASGKNVWEGWVRVPEAGETRRARFSRSFRLIGDFHRMNVIYVPVKSRGAALLALTGDLYSCTRHAIKAGLFLNEWGLWKWEPDSTLPTSHSQTSNATHKKTSLGAKWGSETKADRGRWVQLEAFEEQQIFDAIRYTPPRARSS